MGKFSKSALAATALSILAQAPFVQGAAAQGQINLYCSVQVEWCQAIATNFQKATGITVNMTQKGSGETLAQMRAEYERPRGDVWFGGTGDPHLVAAEEGLLAGYTSPMNANFRIGRSSSIRPPAGSRSVSIRARSALASTPNFWRRRTLKSRPAGLISPRPTTRAKFRSRIPTPPAPPMSSSRRWCSSWARTRRSNT